MQPLSTTAHDEHRRTKRESVRVGRSRVGKGVFAGQNFAAGVMVGEITGEIIEQLGYGSDYCFELGQGRHLEPEAPFRFVNHSCEPNCEFEYLECRDAPGADLRTRLFIFAYRDIKTGEELSIDYNWSADNPIPCRCQAPSCRGWVVGESSLDDLVEPLP